MSGSEPGAGATGSEDRTGSGAGDRSAPGGAEDRLEPLQQAAHQLISAARTFLDAAEAVVDDPEVLGVVAGVVTDTAREAVRVASEAGRRAARAAGAAAGSPGGPPAGGGDPTAADADGKRDGDDGPVTAIPVR